MKIAVSGKGGVGKTTLAAVLARLYAEEGLKVLAADVDPDANLGMALGFEPERIEALTPVSKMSELIAERTAAKKEKNFARADEIREQLLSQGIVLEDTREGVRWKRA